MQTSQIRAACSACWQRASSARQKLQGAAATVAPLATLAASATHPSQIMTPGPAISERTRSRGRMQNEQHADAFTGGMLRTGTSPPELTLLRRTSAIGANQVARAWTGSTGSRSARGIGSQSDRRCSRLSVRVGRPEEHAGRRRQPRSPAANCPRRGIRIGGRRSPPACASRKAWPARQQGVTSRARATARWSSTSRRSCGWPLKPTARAVAQRDGRSAGQVEEPDPAGEPR